MRGWGIVHADLTAESCRLVRGSGEDVWNSPRSGCPKSSVEHKGESRYRRDPAVTKGRI